MPTYTRPGDKGEKEIEMEQKKLEEKLELHRKWLSREEDGERLVLKGAELDHADLSYADLSYADLSYANLKHASFKGAKLTGTDLRAAFANYADFKEASLSGTDLRGASLKCSSFEGTDLRSAKLSNTPNNYANLDSANLNYTNLSGASLSGAKLSGADLRETDLSFSRLIGTDLSDANLNGAKLQGARLENADLKGASLEFCAFPLHDKAYRMHIDDELFEQLLYLAVSAALYSKNTSEELKRFCESEELLSWANRSADGGAARPLLTKRDRTTAEAQERDEPISLSDFSDFPDELAKTLFSFWEHSGESEE